MSGVRRLGKTEFPAYWDEDKIMDHLADVAKHPDEPPQYCPRTKRWNARGTRDAVLIEVV
jgi:hypothetical protein